MSESNEEAVLEAQIRLEDLETLSYLTLLTHVQDYLHHNCSLDVAVRLFQQVCAGCFEVDDRKINHLNRNGPASFAEKENVAQEIQEIASLLNNADAQFLIMYHVEGDSEIQFVKSADDVENQMKMVGYFLGSEVEHSYLY